VTTIYGMKVVGVRELKSRLSQYLQEVRRGEEILVTDRGHVVAEITQPRTGSVDPAIPPGLRELARRGLVKLGDRNHPGLYPLLPRVAPDGTALRLLDEERGDR